MVPWYAWVGFAAGLVARLALDLAIHRGAKRMPHREALLWTLAWVAVALAFAGVMWWWRGPATAGEFVAGYVIEWSLSVDNVFVFFLILAHLAVPAAYQHRVLFWGVMGAVLMRLGFIVGGAALIHRFDWMTWVFGALLLVTAVRFLREREGAASFEENSIFRVVRRAIPMTDRYQGTKLLTRANGRLTATPLLAAVVLVNVIDVVFAVDSIPAVFSVTRDPFVAFTSNALAILGLRSLYFVVAGAVLSFYYLRPALATVLVFVGGKMLLSPWVELPLELSLGIIVGILGTGIGVSVFRGSRQRIGRSVRSGTTRWATPAKVTLILVASLLAASIVMVLAFESIL
jgi:tellurite resistance protein TerC